MKTSCSSPGITGPISDFLLALYPGHWRQRYEDEFRAVLEDCPPSVAVIADICWGALVARFTYGRAERQRAACRRARTRRAATAAFLLIALSNAPVGSGRFGPYRPLRAILS